MTDPQPSPPQPRRGIVRVACHFGWVTVFPFYIIFGVIEGVCNGFVDWRTDRRRNLAGEP